MRIKPTAFIAVAVFVVYVTIVSLLWKLHDFEYDELSDSVENLRNGVVLPIAAGALFLAVVTTVLGWWRPVIVEPRRLRTKLAVLLPVVLVLGGAANLAVTDWDAVTGEYLVWVTVGVLLVGFAEELLCRGIALVGARGSFGETAAMWFTAALFGLLHVPNAFFGQSVRATVQQVIFATVLGIVYYAVRRGTATLVVPMLLHALWDGSLFVNDHSGADPSPVASLCMLAAIAVAVIALRRSGRAERTA